MPTVILVDENDTQIGTAEKLQAHRDGALHRAISLFIFNDKGELMLQKRADHKYHSGGLWTNTVCSHPEPGETSLDAAHRRLQEEMGFDCEMEELFTFTYRAEFDNGLIEHEFDHTFFGIYNEAPLLNKEEASDWRWISPSALKKEIEMHPTHFSYWLKTCLDQVIEKTRERFTHI